LLIAGEKAFGDAPLIPNQHHPARMKKNSTDLSPGGEGTKPVKNLPGGHQVHACTGQSGVLRCPVAFEYRKWGQDSLPGTAHFRVGLDAAHRASQLQEQLRQQVRSGTDVGYHGIRAQATLAPSSAMISDG